MKQMYESSEVFQLYAQIDYCHYMLEEINNQLGRSLSPIEQMVDSATGYGEVRIKEYAKNAIELLKTIIDCKKKIEADYSKDEEALNALLNKFPD
jgi:hypothetical protein